MAILTMAITTTMATITTNAITMLQYGALWFYVISISYLTCPLCPQSAAGLKM
jgi:hypothetical protein